jgi:ABC-type lipoprotein export system ATPase subunit
MDAVLQVRGLHKRFGAEGTPVRADEPTGALDSAAPRMW